MSVFLKYTFWRGYAKKPIMCCFLLAAVTVFSTSVWAQDEHRAPFVSNVHAEQRTDTKLVDITYDVDDPDGDLLTIIVSVSDDGVMTFFAFFWH